MKFITTIIAALICLSVPALAAETAPEQLQEPAIFVSLTPNVTVTNGVVRLGDIFNSVGANADKVVAYAPRPGARAVFDARWLSRVAAAYKLNWRPGSNTARVVVERASQLVTKVDIERLLQQRHIDNGGDPSSRAPLSNRIVPLHLPTPEVDAQNVSLGV